MLIPQVLEEAEAALQNDLQWALELSSNVFHANPASEKAKEIRTQALLDIAAQQICASARNYLLTYILQDRDILPTRYSHNSQYLVIMCQRNCTNE